MMSRPPPTNLRVNTSAIIPTTFFDTLLASATHVHRSYCQPILFAYHKQKNRQQRVMRLVKLVGLFASFI